MTSGGKRPPTDELRTTDVASRSKQRGSTHLPLARAIADRLAGASTGDEEPVIAALVLEVVKQAMSRAALDAERLSGLRLVRLAAPFAVSAAERTAIAQFLEAAEEENQDPRLSWAHRVGQSMDLARAVQARGLLSGDRSSLRRQTGSYFTPRVVAHSVVTRGGGSLAIDLQRHDSTEDGEVRKAQMSLPFLGHAHALAVCDPAVGGGAFLLEAAAFLEHSLLKSGRVRDASQARVVAVSCLYGVDRSELACAVAEAALFVFCPEAFEHEESRPRFAVADTLRDDVLELPGFPARGFDWIVTNPPWVAYQGRAAQALTVEERAFFRERYHSFQGYPTLHGMFVERSTELAPHGVLSLLLPSSLSDLNGYAATRHALTRTHVPREPLLEYGQDAFSGVVQPCFALVARPRLESDAPGTGEVWKLEERQRQKAVVQSVPAPEVLAQLTELPKLPAACFGELGFQSNRRVAQELFLRTDHPQDPFTEPLLQGRNVAEFREAKPTLFMHPDPEVLRATRCRLRDLAAYHRVSFVVRQTAAYTIAALHEGQRFRNSLIAGYAQDGFDGPLLVALLNSALYRAFHLSRQRDARQAAFPQVKVRHLRDLPAPPHGATWDQLRGLCLEAHARGGLDGDKRRALDQAVFDLFSVSREQREQTLEYLSAHAPKAIAPSLGEISSGL